MIGAQQLRDCRLTTQVRCWLRATRCFAKCFLRHDVGNVFECFPHAARSALDDTVGQVTCRVDGVGSGGIVVNLQ